MVAIRSLAALATVLGFSCAAAIVEEAHWTTTLLKRQAPGTPAYDCHLNCGTAITIGRTAGTSRCTNSTFLDDYQACLECAAPDNQDIWQYYGGTLTPYGSSCGLSTTPISGSASSTSASETVVPSTTSTVETTPAPDSTTAEPTPTTTPEDTSPTAETTPAPDSTSAEPTPTSSAGETTASTSASGETTAATSAASTTSAPATTSGPLATTSAHSTGSATTSAGNSTSTTIPFTGAANGVHSQFAGGVVALVAAVLASFM